MNNPETRSRLVTVAEIAILAAVLAAGLLIGWSIARKAPAGQGGQNGNQNQGVATTTTRSEVPTDIVVPDAGAQVSGDVAVPVSVAPAAPGVEAKRRTFDITFNGNTFSPANVIVHAGDTTSIRFKTTSGTCSFVQPDLGLSATFTSQREQLIEVTPPATATGKYQFFCSNLGGPSQGPIGYLVVASR